VATEPLFRFMEEADVPRVLELVNDYSLELSSVGMDGPRATEYRRYLQATIANRRHFVLLILLDGEIRGFADYCAEQGEQDSRVCFGEIIEFYVVPACRRRGLGTRLARRAIDHLRLLGADLIDLGVLKTNVAGTSFWESLGFRDRSVRKRMYL
jgi:ribosomal protein S18 acetylase RimI-like enzyme